MAENEISRVVVDAAIEVRRTLGGPGLLESMYEEALAYELELRGLTVEHQRVVPGVYKGKRLGLRHEDRPCRSARRPHPLRPGAFAPLR